MFSGLIGRKAWYIHATKVVVGKFNAKARGSVAY